MRVFYKPSDKTVCELNDARLKMYQRLLRLHEENPEGVHHVLKALKGLEPAADEHGEIAEQLRDVNFVRRVEGGGLAINTDHVKFINYITKTESAWVGLLRGGFKIVDVNLITDIQMALKNDDVISRMQPIAPEAINARADMCRIS